MNYPRAVSYEMYFLHIYITCFKNQSSAACTGWFSRTSFFRRQLMCFLSFHQVRVKHCRSLTQTWCWNICEDVKLRLNSQRLVSCQPVQIFDPVRFCVVYFNRIVFLFVLWLVNDLVTFWRVTWRKQGTNTHKYSTLNICTLHSCRLWLCKMELNSFASETSGWGWNNGVQLRQTCISCHV